MLWLRPETSRVRTRVAPAIGNRRKTADDCTLYESHWASFAPSDQVAFPALEAGGDCRPGLWVALRELAGERAERAAAACLPVGLMLDECVEPAVDTSPGVQVVEEFALRVEEILIVKSAGVSANAEDYSFSQRAAASAVSSGRVLNAIEAVGSDLCTAFTTCSNRSKLLGGIRRPPPITTQSYVTRESCRSIAEVAVPSGRTRHRSGCQPLSDICRIPTSMLAWIFFASNPGGNAGSEKSTVSGS